jgi:hypothetical protein
MSKTFVNFVYSFENRVLGAHRTLTLPQSGEGKKEKRFEKRLAHSSACPELCRRGRGREPAPDLIRG